MAGADAEIAPGVRDFFVSYAEADRDWAEWIAWQLEEWAAAFARDPDGRDRRLIPVRVEPGALPGMIGQIIYIDLVGLPKSEAAAALLAGLNPSRAKPTTRPPFPGPA